MPGRRLLTSTGPSGTSAALVGVHPLLLLPGLAFGGLRLLPALPLEPLPLPALPLEPLAALPFDSLAIGEAGLAGSRNRPGLIRRRRGIGTGRPGPVPARCGRGTTCRGAGTRTARAERTAGAGTRTARAERTRAAGTRTARAERASARVAAPGQITRPGTPAGAAG